MMKKIFNKKSLFIFLAVAILTIAGCSKDDKNSEVVATVDGEKITKEELYDVLVNASGGQALNALIDQKIVELEIKKEGIKISDEELQTEVDNFIEEAGGEEVFNEKLEETGLTMEDFEEEVTQYLSIRKLMEPLIDITDEELEEFFEENHDRYDIAAEVNARHILVEDEELANQLYKQIKDGADFAELAKLHSEDGSAQMGGELGFFGYGEMVPEFEEKAFSLKPGELGEPVKSTFGYHIIETLEKIEEEKAIFEDFEEEVRETLFEQKMQMEYVTWLDEKRESYKIENKLNE